MLMVEGGMRKGGVLEGGMLKGDVLRHNAEGGKTRGHKKQRS